MGIDKPKEDDRDANIRRLVEADQYERDAPMGRNGGVACDVRRGPCACGAWHFGY